MALALDKGMRTADNDNNSTVGTTLSSEGVASDTGLSSAMHDIRLLAKTYQEHQGHHLDSSSQLHHPSAAVDPRVLLVPTMQPRLERWKLAMLTMMILVGLSTSAIAVRLVMQSTPGPYTQDYESLKSSPERTGTAPLDQSTTEPVPTVDTSSAESTGYELTSSPASSRANPSSHQASSPAIKSPAKAKIALRKSVGKNAAASTEPADTCDEVACLVGVGGDCCELALASHDNTDEREEIAERPYRLSRAQVMEPMQRIQGRVRTCGDNHDFQGVALVKIVIAPDGSVDSMALGEGSEGFQSCVSTQVSTLHFPKLRQPFTVSYPFTLR